MYTAELWKENRAALPAFDEAELIREVNSVLSLRNRIEKIIDEIWANDFDSIFFIGIGGTYASCRQAEVFMRGRSSLPVYAENAAEFNTTGNKRLSAQSVVIFSSVSGTTPEMITMVRRIHEAGAKAFGFVDTENSELAGMADWVISVPKQEQLKFFLVCTYLMYRNHEFDEYDRFCRQLSACLAKDLAEIEKESDAWAKQFAQKTSAFLKEHPDMPHYFIASGNLAGAAYSAAMCYWAEQLWIRTVYVSAQDFFHGMQEVITRDVPVILFVGEDEQRPLAERAARFLPKVCANYTIIDSSEFLMNGIDEQFRGILSPLVIRSVMNRIDAWLEIELRHPRSIRRYYRQFDY